MTKNFKRQEFEKSKKALELRVDNSIPATLESEMQKTAELMQEIRDFTGKPITITSGYRCEKVNAAVGGAKDSDHIKAKGVDYYVHGYTYAEHEFLMKLLQKRFDIRYMKIYPDNRLHMSRK